MRCRRVKGQVPRLVEYATRSSGWRRVAAELMLVDATNARVQWHDRAARHGSRYAAFMPGARTGRQGRGARVVGPHLDDAYAWFVIAGADFRIARLGAKFDAAGLARAQAKAAGLMEDPWRRSCARRTLRSPRRDDVARLRRRAEMVGVRAKVTGGHDMRNRDANAHAIAHAEATRDFTALAKYYGEPLPGGSSPRDADLAAWLHLLAAKKGEAPAMIDTARMLEHSPRHVPKNVEYLYAWNALAAERLQAAPSEDEALVAVAITGRDRARGELDPARLRDAEALLAALRANVPSR